MLATELLFTYIYCLVDDAIKAGTLLIPRRPGPAPACTDASTAPGSAVPTSGPAPATTGPPGSAATARMLNGSTEGFNGTAFATQMTTAGIEVIIPPPGRSGTPCPSLSSA